MSIEPMLVLSTAHLPPAVMALVSAQDRNITRTIPHDYGAIVYAHDENLNPDLPAEVAVVLAYARSRGCDWVNFDRDADTVGDLPTWDLEVATEEGVAL